VLQGCVERLGAPVDVCSGPLDDPQPAGLQDPAWHAWPQGINEQKYQEIIVRLSNLLRFATEIKGWISTLAGRWRQRVAVDARIRVAPSKDKPGCFAAFLRSHESSFIELAYSTAS
jgi:hypothetical protein